MPETLITRRESAKKFSRATGTTHQFRLRRFRGHVLEVDDVHFHHDSAVLLPDFEPPPPAPGSAPPPHDDRITGLAVLRACFLHARRNPAQKMLITGHADTSGSVAYNITLTQMRADNVFHALMGNRDGWVQIALQKHKVEDYQQILKWVSTVYGWPCDPGPIDNVQGPQTEAATREFQRNYNMVFNPPIAEDGVVGRETWGAFFDVYMDVLADILDTDEAGLAAMRARFIFLDPAKKTVGCGEHFPIEQPRRDNYRSQINRRVEILFFDAGEEPQLNCHPRANACTPQLCEIYNLNIYDFTPIPVNPIPFQPRFRMRLELGDIDALFPAITAQNHTDVGVRRRLQAIGFLYEPLNSPNIAQIAQDAWNHFKRIINQNNDAQACVRLQQMIREEVLKITDADTGRLPAAGEFGMIRFPGTYCVTIADFNANFFGNPGSSGANSFHFRLETNVWNANPSLGLIPIVARVESKSELGRVGTWRPAGPGVRVHFQLITPDAPAAGTPTAPPALRNTPITGSSNPNPPGAPIVLNMTGSPNAYVTAERARNPQTPDDPRVDNAHQTVGGKRGNAVAGTNRQTHTMLITNTIAGFHDRFNFNAGQASRHPNAAAVDTNAQGEATLVFMPGWTGGDRYKIRAFLDPLRGQASNGTEDGAVSQETGTMVVWRILRFSNYLRWNYPATTTPAQSATCGGALENFDIAGLIATEYRKAWLDVVIEPGADAPRNITQAEWRTMMQFVKGRLVVGGLSQAYDLNALLPDTDAAAGVNNPSPGIIRILNRAQYNAARGPGFPQAPNQTGPGSATFWNDMARVFFAAMDLVQEFYTRNAISGLTIIQAPVLTSLEADREPGMPTGPNDPWFRSGWGTSRRGCYVFFGQNVYNNPAFPYSSTHNTMHETGHVLYGVHQYTAAAQANVNTGGIFDEHDYHDLCIMGYMSTSRDFCGRCVLNLAGWNTHAMPANSPGP